MVRVVVGALLVCVMCSTGWTADEPPPVRSTSDRQIIDSLARIHDRGASMFNAGDQSGCYRLFQGSLLTLKIVLPKELQEHVDRGLEMAERQVDMGRRAMALHEVIEDVRKKLHPTAGKGEALPKPRTAPGLTDDGNAVPRGVPKAPSNDNVVEGTKPTGPSGRDRVLEGPKLPETPAKPKDVPKLLDTPVKIPPFPKAPDAKDDIPKLTSEPKKSTTDDEAPKLGPLTTPEPPRAPASPPGKFALDPPPPVTGLPMSLPKAPKPSPPPQPNDPTVPDLLTVPPRPIDPPMKPKPMDPGSAPPLPAPPSGPELEIPPVSTFPPKPKDPPPALKVPK